MVCKIYSSNCLLYMAGTERQSAFLDTFTITREILQVVEARQQKSSPLLTGSSSKISSAVFYSTLSSSLSLWCKSMEHDSCYFLSLFFSTNCSLKYHFQNASVCFVFTGFSFFNISPNKGSDSTNDTCIPIFAFTSCRTYSYSRHTS